jgi:2-phosphosulfolactate phosphatase
MPRPAAPSQETNVEIRRATLATCGEASGTVVVIDVLRAFTTAAYAFAAGALDITMVANVEEAFAIRERNPGWLIMGEVDGWPVEGFDFGNSPSIFLERGVAGRHLVQRTSSGTQGVVRSRQATNLLAASLCCGTATVEYIRRQAPVTVSLVITGSHAGSPGDEDVACADYLEALLRGSQPDTADIVRRVRHSWAARKFDDPCSAEFPPTDLDCAVDIDRFDFAMPVRRQRERLVLERIQILDL